MSNEHLIFKTFEEVGDWAGDNYKVKDRCEGTPEETLMAGWTNAMDMLDEAKGNLTEEELMIYTYDAFNNMGYNC